MKKIGLILCCLALIFALCLPLISCGNENQTTTVEEQDQNAKDYSEALSLLENGNYEGAKALFEKLGDYKDAQEYLSKFYYLPYWINNGIIGKGGAYEYFFDENNLMSKYVVHREGQDAYCEFFYYEDGNIKQQAANFNGIRYSFDYTYTANGQRETGIYKVGDVVTYIHTFIYDENGNELEFRIVDTQGNTVQLITSVYDEKGNCIRKEYCFEDPENNYNINTEYVFNDAGMLIREVRTDDSGVQESMDYTWDESGNMIKKVYTIYDGSVYVYDFIYDEHGNMVKEILTDEDGVTQYVEYEYVLLYLPTGLTNATRIFFTETFEEQL
jgi:DUF2075 family protein